MTSKPQASMMNNSDMWWMLAAIGVWMVALAQLIWFAIHVGDAAGGSTGGKTVTSYILLTLGSIMTSSMMALAAAMGRGWNGGVRATMLLGSLSTYFLLGGVGLGHFSG
jgi:hypothetical protein